VTHTLYAFVNSPADLVSGSLAGLLPPIPAQRIDAFEAAGRSDLRHDAGRRPFDELNARSA